MIKLSERRVWVGLTILAILFAVSIEIARADVGEEEICNERLGFSINHQVLSTTSDGGQTFTTTEQFTISGVKLPIFQYTTDGTGNVRLRITETIADSGGVLRPDYNNILLEESFSTTILPQVVNPGTSAVQTLLCDSDDGNGTVFEFTSPITLSASTVYAVTADTTSGAADARWGVVVQTAPGYDNYAGGRFTRVTSSGDPFNPDDWDNYCTLCTPNGTDSGFAIYNNIANPVERNFDSWIDNFLTGIGMNSPVGKLLIGSLFGGILFFILSAWKVPWIISLAVAGMAGTTLTAAAVFDPAILLTLVAIIGLGMIGLIFALFLGGGNRDGG